MMITINAALILALAPLPSTCTVTDGDTIRCGDERIRLLAIDAPEISPCRKGRVCVPGDGQASKRHLEQLMRGKALRIERHGRDRYGRTLAYVWAGKVKLSCAMVKAGQAVWVERWNSGGAGVLRANHLPSGCGA